MTYYVWKLLPDCAIILDCSPCVNHLPAQGHFRERRVEVVDLMPMAGIVLTGVEFICEAVCILCLQGRPWGMSGRL